MALKKGFVNVSTDTPTAPFLFLAAGAVGEVLRPQPASTIANAARIDSRVMDKFLVHARPVKRTRRSHGRRVRLTGRRVAHSAYPLPCVCQELTGLIGNRL